MNNTLIDEYDSDSDNTCCHHFFGDINDCLSRNLITAVIVVISILLVLGVITVIIYVVMPKVINHVDNNAGPIVSITYTWYGTLITLRIRGWIGN